MTSRQLYRLRRWVEIVFTVVVFIVFLLACFCSCKTQTSVVRESRLVYARDTIYFRDTIMYNDSVYVRDSIYVKDSVVHHDHRAEYYKQQAASSVEHKVEYVYVKDSIPYPIEVIKEVAAPMNGWQRFIQASGYGLWAVLLLALICGVVTVIIRFRR